MTQGNNYGVLSARFTSITNAAELTLYGAITKKFKLSTLPILNFVKQIVELALNRLSCIHVFNVSDGTGTNFLVL